MSAQSLALVTSSELTSIAQKLKKKKQLWLYNSAIALDNLWILFLNRERERERERERCVCVHGRFQTKHCIFKKYILSVHVYVMYEGCPRKKAYTWYILTCIIMVLFGTHQNNHFWISQWNILACILSVNNIFITLEPTKHKSSVRATLTERQNVLRNCLMSDLFFLKKSPSM